MFLSGWHVRPLNPTRSYNNMPKGFKHSKETKEKIRETNKGKHYSLKTEFKKGQRAWNKDKCPPFVITDEYREKMRKIALEKGYGKWMNGKKLSPETILKMSEVKQGSKHNQWQGGKSFEKYTIEWNKFLKENIRKRDNYVCQKCGIHQYELNTWFKKLDVHHIDYNKKNCNPDNLIILCHNCHMKTNFNRNYWTNYFNNLLKIYAFQ